MNSPKWLFFIIMMSLSIYIGIPEKLNLKAILDTKTLNNLKEEYNTYNENISNSSDWYKKFESIPQEKHTERHKESMFAALKSGCPSCPPCFSSKSSDYVFLLVCGILCFIIITCWCVIYNYYWDLFKEIVYNIQDGAPFLQRRLVVLAAFRRASDAIEMQNRGIPPSAVPLERREVPTDPIENPDPRNLLSIFHNQSSIVLDRVVQPQEIAMEPENMRMINVFEMNVRESLVQSDQWGGSTRRTDVDKRIVPNDVQSEQSSLIPVQAAHTSKHIFTVQADIHSPPRHIHRHNTRSQSKNIWQDGNMSF